KDVFRSGDSSKKFKIAEGQWYRYAPSYVSPAYHLLEGFPFIQEPPSGDLQERVLIRHHDYDQCFQSVQLLQWNSQVKFNVTVYRNLPTTRDSIINIFTFYVPHRHVYGEQWIKFMKDGVNATPLPTVNTTGYIDHAAFLGTINPDT